MPQEIRVVDQKFYSKLKNGDTFTLNPSDFSRHLKDGVLGEIKAVFNVQASWFLNLENYNLLVDNTANTIRIESSGIDFSLHGFSVGDSIKFSQGGSEPQLTADVTSLQIGEMILNNVLYQQGTFPNGYNIDYLGKDPLTGLTSKTSLEYKFGLIENNEPANFLSKLTNTEQILQFEGIDHANPLTFVNGKSFGTNKAWVTGSSRCAFVGLTPDKDWNRTENTTQEFQIEHTFKINPAFRDGEEESLQGTEKPPLDIFNGSKSLKYVFKTDFRTVLNNPNTSIIGEYDTQEGSVGYFGESFNGYDNHFSVSNLNYSINGKSATKIEVGEVVNVTFDIDSDTSIMTSDMPVIFGHSSLVDSIAYGFNKDKYDDVWTDEQKRVVTGVASSSGTLLKNVATTFVNSNKISVSFDVEFTANQIKRLEDGQDYILYYQIADNTQLIADSGKVTNLIDLNQYFKNNDVAGLFGVDNFMLSPHPLPNINFTNSKTFNESGTLFSGDFWVKNGAELKTLDFDLVIFKKDDETWTDFRILSIDISDAITSNGIKQIEIDSTRNYILKEIDSFNYLKISTGINNGLKQFYKIDVAFKIPFQEWLELQNAPTDFYDKSNQSFNGLNQKASNYSRKGTGLNTFVDGDRGTFESGVLGLTVLLNSVGFEHQIGSNILQSPIDVSKSGFYSAKISFGSNGMTQANKTYDIFKTDTNISVIQGVSYELVYYICTFAGTNEPSHYDNGAIFLSPSGYLDSEIEVDSFLFNTKNDSANANNIIWVKCSTFFTAKTTENITIYCKENIKNNITVSTGADIYIDDITLKTVDYDIRTLLRSKVDSTDYAIASEEINVYDYNQDDLIQDGFSCQIKTLDINEVDLLNNIINKDYTELRALFTPLVPPVFTESVDFSQVATMWNRFAHGNKLSAPATIAPRGGDWLLEEANDTDTFTDINGGQHTKVEAGLYTSTPTTIQTTENNNALYGLFSLDKLQFYELSGKMFSNAPDNDGIIYNICYNVGDDGEHHTLSLIATTGGILADLNPSFILGNDQTSTMGFVNQNINVSIVYDYGKRRCKQLDYFEIPLNGYNWSASGDLFFEVKRSSDDIEINIDWLISGNNYLNTFNINLNNDVDTVKFKGFQHIGFAFMSQDQGGFKDVVLTKSSGDYYGILRIDEENSQTDKSINELSTLHEAPENNLLTQISGNEKKSLLSYDGTNFILQGVVDTSKIDLKKNYSFSAEIRTLVLDENVTL